jgi:tetratricopeptide (TPR) repeat protein
LGQMPRFIGRPGEIPRASRNKEDELYATTLELENTFLMRDGEYDKAIENFNTLKTNFEKNEETYKHALFNLGYINYYPLNNQSTGQEYFAELKNKYPDDELTQFSMLLLGEIDNIPAHDQGLPKKLLTEDESTNEFALSENYPNPFNPSTTINYTLPEGGKVQIRIFDILGCEVATLMNGFDSKGQHSVVWDGSNAASGIYFYNISFKNQAMNKKMLLVK